MTTNEERVLRGARGLKRDKVVKIARMAGCKNIVGKRERSLYSMCSQIIVLSGMTPEYCHRTILAV